MNSDDMEDERTEGSSTSQPSLYLLDEAERCQALLMKLPETIGRVTLEDRELRQIGMNIQRKDIEKLQGVSLYFVDQEDAEKFLSASQELRILLASAVCALFAGLRPASLSSLFHLACCENEQHMEDCDQFWEDLKQNSLEMVLSDKRLRVAVLAEAVPIESERTESVDRSDS